LWWRINKNEDESLSLYENARRVDNSFNFKRHESMKLPKSLTICLSLITMASAAFGALMAGGIFQMERAWVGGAGASAASASFHSTASVGQGIAGAVISGGAVQLRGGFIQSFSAAVIVPAALGTTCSNITDPTQSTTCSVTTPAGPVTVTIPAGTFVQPVTMTLTVPPSFPAGPSSVGTLNGLGIGVIISFSPSATPQAPYLVTFPYQEPSLTSGREDRVRPALYDTATGRWIPLSGDIDTANNTVTLRTTNVATFQLVELLPAADLERAVAFPNPMRASRGHQRMSFGNLPEDVRIQLFTLTGELVKTLFTDGAGQVSWDGNNGDGEKVVSGIYLAVIQRGSDNRVIKIAVER
jgi:hypothetical protein